MEEIQLIKVGNNNTANLLKEYHKAVKNELKEILQYWVANTKDSINGGFVGRIDENNIVYPNAPKGAVLHCRILWAFSEAFKIDPDPEYLKMATIAFDYISAHFVDKKEGGVYWTVNANGQPLDTKKQIYAIAFAIYGCSVYFEACKNNAAKKLAINLYETIEKYSYDKEFDGYMEAFEKDWKPIADLRLSHKDANEKKTANTHLHVLEAYSSLCSIWPDMHLKLQLQNLIGNFLHHIIDASTGHLILFFDEQWNSRSTLVSYGHDIEAAWLLMAAAATAGDKLLEQKVKNIVVNVAIASTEGLNPDGSLGYEYEPANNHLINEKHWWVQAEAMVGFFNHWQLTGEDSYLEKSYQSWLFTAEFIKDKTFGEWLWGRNADGSIMIGEDKVGIWKCPYHNARACIEILKRIQTILPIN